MGLGEGLAAVGLALLAATPLSIAAQAQTAAPLEGAASRGRPRPNYERVLALRELRLDPATRPAAETELRTKLSAWYAGEFGFGETTDTDVVLASATALSLLAHEPAQAQALSALLDRLDEELRPAPRDPDLALALSVGTLTLEGLRGAASTGGHEAPLAERIGRLDSALDAAEAIDATDQRDQLGCALAARRHELQSAAGPTAGAVEALERAMATFPTDLVARAQLLCRCADERKLTRAWAAVWADLGQAQQALEQLRAKGKVQGLCSIERYHADVHCQVELALGLLDRAAASLDAERDAIDKGANDSDSRLGLLLNVMGVALSSGQPRQYGRAMEEVDRTLASPQAFADRPGYRAWVRAQRALLEQELEQQVPVPEPRAPALMKAAIEDPALDDAHRTTLGLNLATLAIRRRELEEAGRWLVFLAAPSAERRVPELEAAVKAVRAQLALARGEGREVLERHFKELDTEYRAFVAAWAASPEREGGLGFLRWRFRKVLVGTLVDLCLALDGAQGPEHAIDLVLLQQANGSLARRLHCEPGTLAAARSALLGSGIGLLLYVPGADGMNLFCVDGKRVEAFPLSWSKQDEAKVRSLAGALSTSPFQRPGSAVKSELEEIELLAGELADSLLPPPARERLAGWTGVYVVGADDLGGVPFEILRVGDKQLGARIALAYLPSLPVGIELAGRAAADHTERGLDLALLAAPELAAAAIRDHTGLGALPFAEEQESALTSAFAKKRVLSAAHANWEQLLAVLTESPAVLHFLVHGVSDPERELPGGLALAPGKEDPDGILWCEELFQRDFTSPPLVLFSSCGSARGPRRDGDDGVAQFGGAFLAHGGRCTVQAVNDIALEPTIRLMSVFSREVAAGRSPAAAMFSARGELLSDPRFRHPFYSCSMRVVGLGFEPVMKRAH